MNVRTMIQQAWGALKFAEPELRKLGYTDTTGYNAMGPMAKKALAERKVDWKGERLPDDAELEKRRLQRLQKAESTVMAQAVKDNPRLPGETEAQWLARVTEGAREMAEEARQQAESEAVATIVSGLFDKHSDDRLNAIACAIFDRLAERHGVDYEYSTAMSDDAAERADEDARNAEPEQHSEQEPAHA
jgi:hypothetical protein